MPRYLQHTYEMEVGLWLNIQRFEAKEKLNGMESVQFAQMDQLVPREWFEIVAETQQEASLMNAEVNLPRSLHRHQLSKGD